MPICHWLPAAASMEVSTSTQTPASFRRQPGLALPQPSQQHVARSRPTLSHLIVSRDPLQAQPAIIVYHYPYSSTPSYSHHPLITVNAPLLATQAQKDLVGKKLDCPCKEKQVVGVHVPAAIHRTALQATPSRPDEKSIMLQSHEMKRCKRKRREIAATRIL
ncbi:hypothetical protein L1887_55288 [Cichorium endivia]|nr:hypothetical protein L1887_55288 [Cichorium endivia]